MKGYVLPGVLLLFYFTDFKQEKRLRTQEQVLIGCFNQTRFRKRWGAWLDLHLRTKDDYFDLFSQSLVRGGIAYI